MRDLEHKVLRFLIFITLLFVNYHILLLVTSFIAPEGFLDNMKRIGGFFINLIGLHTLFAFSTFIYSRRNFNKKIKYYLLRLSLISPIVYVLFNLDFLNTFIMLDIYILLILLFFIKLFYRNFKYNYVMMYLNILVDPLYNDDAETF